MANTMRIGFQLTNFDEMRQLLKDLPPSVESRVMGDAVQVATKPIVQAARSNAPVDTGALRRSITSVVRRYPRAGKIVGIIGPSKDFFQSGKRLKKTANRQGADRPANYAHLVEFGHLSALGTGRRAKDAKGKSVRKGTLDAVSFIMPRPFLRPAVMIGAPMASAALANGVSVGMEREVRRLASKMKRIKKG